MRTSRKLGLIAIVTFLISFFLPAYSGGSGFDCFGYCWNLFLGHDGFGNKIPILSGGWFYYSGFVISNILFIGLVVALLVTNKSRRPGSLVSIVCFLQALSWLVCNVIFGKPSQITEFNIGYYAWLIAYGLLVAAHLREEPVESHGSIPLARSAV